MLSTRHSLYYYYCYCDRISQLWSSYLSFRFASSAPEIPYRRTGREATDHISVLLCPVFRFQEVARVSDQAHLFTKGDFAHFFSASPPLHPEFSQNLPPFKPTKFLPPCSCNRGKGSESKEERKEKKKELTSGEAGD